MKKFTILLALILLCSYGMQAGTAAFPDGKPHPGMTWKEQIVAYLSQKKVMRQANWEGVILLSFQVTADNRLTGLEVHTSDERLKANLVKQLTGKKLHGLHSDPQQTHTVRLRL